ncbi:MSH2 protein, partial [Spiromyces aspiralis]
MVQVFFDDMGLRESVRNVHLRLIPDLRRISKRFKSGKASLQDAVRIYQFIVKLPGLAEILEAATIGSDLICKNFITPIKESMQSLSKLQDLVETTIDLELVDRHEYVIKPEFDSSLRELMNGMEAAMKEMIDEQTRVADALGLEVDKKLKLEKNGVFGYCLRLTRTEAPRIRNKGSQYIELVALKTGVYFTTPRLREHSHTYSDLSNEYERKQSSLIKEVVRVISTYCPVLESLNGVIAHLDVLVSFAEASAAAPIPYVRPVIKEEGDLILKEARHPCLEVQDEISFIPNDVSMVRGRSEFEIITGPNMGGKSTYIRQIGVIALMAQVGCFVPCSKAETCIFDCILARVGAGDAQLKGVSTFMAEMLETASILKAATPQSLIIIDELGRGTSTYDGFGLAWAISEKIITEVHSFCLFATHFHELTVLEQQHPG